LLPDFRVERWAQRFHLSPFTILAPDYPRALHTAMMAEIAALLELLH
jgi:hypothetical protein